MKICSKCGEEGDFHRCTAAKDGLQPWCKKCQTAWLNANRERRQRAARKWSANNPDHARKKRLAKYGLTFETYAAMLVAQGDRCASCRDQLDHSKPKHVHIDHCHTTGRTRGVLCRFCNVALGQLQDSPGRIERLLDYARSTSCE